MQGTKHLVDPELLPLIEVLPAPVAYSLQELPKIRETFGALLTLLPPAPPNEVVVTEHYVPGPDGGPQVRILIYTPPGDARKRPALLHIHGGGYVLGSPEVNDARNQSFSADLGCVIVSVDYRLCPEHPFPVSVEDCHAALDWLYRHAAELGIDANKIAIGGESAGGGLAAALCLLARDRAQVSVAFQLLIYPMLDDRTATTLDANPTTGEFGWTREANRFGWSALLGKAPGGEGVSPYAAAARAENVAGLPPTYIAVGALDLFVEENITYAQRLMRAGVTTELHVYPGAFHGFDIAIGTHVAKQFDQHLRPALRKAWGLNTQE